MSNFGLSILNGCRIGIRPGFNNPTNPGQPGSTPVILVPSAPDPPDPPFTPNNDPPGSGGGDPNFPFPQTPFPRRPTTTAGPSTGGTISPAGPAVGGRPTTGGPAVGGPTTPTTGIPGVPAPTPTGGVGRPVTGVPGGPTAAPPLPPTGGVGRPLTGVPGEPIPPTLPEPTQAQLYVKQLVNQANIVQEGQRNENGSEVNVDEYLTPRFQSNLNQGLYAPLTYDPQKNFFKVPESPDIIPVPNPERYTTIFRNTIDNEVGKLLNYQNSRSNVWDEYAIQNITNDKILFSLRENIVEAFNNLRDISGNVIGLETFLESFKKHLLTGSLDDFNPQYYLDLYASQRRSQYSSVTASESENLNQTFSLLYLRDPEYGLGTPKNQEQNRFQMNRFRFLNEDLEVTLNAIQLDESESNIAVPNEGIPITLLTPKDASTPPSVGSPDLLNIGDGGGYYFQASTLTPSNTPIITTNLTSSTYYAPAAVRSNLLGILDKPFTYKIRATSLTDQHEFVSGDRGPSALTPLYFGVDLSSVSSFSYNEGVVESYSAAYSRIVNSDSIQQHINNNALSIPELYLDYRDPMYRYILDTSSFTVRSDDVSNKGFVSNPSILGDDNFVKNIPFGFIVVPSRGSNFNPFNGRSKVRNLTDKVERELVVRPGLTSNSEKPSINFEYYNLYLDDGSERVGSFEDKSIHNFGYRYHASAFYNTFFSGGALSTSSEPVSSYGASFLVKDVLDYIKDEYNPESIVWFDVFRRMPLSRIGELSYDLHEGFLRELENGFRHGIKIKNAQSNADNPVSLLEDDDRTVVKVVDRLQVRRS